MKSTELEAGGERSYALVFDAGDEVVAELDRFAAEHSLTASHFTGLGAFSDVVLGFFSIEADRHDTLGHCLVNHCVNDIHLEGARPLYVLDYVAFGKLVPSVVEALVRNRRGG